MEEILVIISCIILSAFFSGMEIAYISSNKIFFEIEKKQNTLLGRIIKKLTESPSKFIATMLIGNNVVMVIYGYYMGDFIMDWLEKFNLNLTDFSSFLLQTLISTLIILITAEFLPKVFFQIYANSLFKLLAVPVYIFYLIFYFFSWMLIGISDYILKIFFNTSKENNEIFFSKLDIRNYISEQMNAVTDHETIDSEIQIFQNALDFPNTKAREIMQPRTDIYAVEISDSVAELEKMFIDSGFSKILIYQETLDDIVGYVHSFDLFKKPKNIKNVLIPIEYVPETMFIKDIMNLLSKKRKSVAVVLDEYGGTSGMITMEDIVEELFGEIEDEHDHDENIIELQIDDNTFEFSTRLEVSYLNEVYKLNISEADSYTSLGGFIVNHTNEIPDEGENIEIDNFEFNILEAFNNKIERVKMTVKK
jgi:CBS domain containing-hemolysin-like protein